MPATIQQFALGSFSRQEAVVANVVATVQPAAGGAPVDAVRQVVAVVGSTPSPYPASPVLDVLRLPARAPLKPGRKPRWRISVAGTQTSTWSYDRSRTEGACTMIASGRGRQTLTFRSVRPWLAEQVTWSDGEPKLRFPGSPYSGTWGNVKIDAVRDSSEQKGATGDCGGAGGGSGDGGPVECERRGSREVEFVVGYIDGRVDAFDYDDRTTVKPDCPFELAEQQVDPLDIINVPPKRGTDLTEGGSPGKVIMLFSATDTSDVGGGKIVSRVRITVTFRRV